MKNLFVVFLLAASLALAAGIPRNSVVGDYVEARTADIYIGACFANSEEGLVGDLAVFGWNIKKGAWDGVNLDGLSVVGVVKASNTLGNVHASAYPVKSVLIVDERASAEQRLALKSFAKKMAGDLLQDIVRVDYQPIEFSFENGDVHSVKANLKVGSLAHIQTRAIYSGDHLCANPEVWYAPLTKLDHAMPAYAVAHQYHGQGLGTTWDSPDKRSAFVGTFHLQE